jgi:peptide/nickel transport system substrate-binding protein
MKGGGDAVSAARAVLQTGEYDFGWNMQVEDDVLQRMEQGGKGKVEISWGGQCEHIHVQLQPTRGARSNGERSSIKAPHPFLTDASVPRH